MNVMTQESPTQSSMKTFQIKHFQQVGRRHSVVEGGHLHLSGENENHDFYFTLTSNQIVLDDIASMTLCVLDQYGLAALAEALFAVHPARYEIRLPNQLDPDWLSQMARSGLITHTAGDNTIYSGDLYQLSLNWLEHPERNSFPLRYTSTNGRRHPVRRPSAHQTLYSRYIPWINKTIRFERADPTRHLGYFHKWMNDPRVDVFWEESGTEAKHQAFLEDRLNDPRTEPLIGFFDDAPFGYFELYWAQEDRLGEHYTAEDFDRGWHVAIGEEAFRGKEYLTAWLPSLMHYMFLDDPRTQRIVGEPDAGHDQQIRNLLRSGFAGLKQVRFPHKTSLLVMLLRERFFDDRLYVPDFVRNEDIS